jgi:flagellar biosynthesis chaperone FliJ
MLQLELAIKNPDGIVLTDKRQTNYQYLLDVTKQLYKRQFGDLNIETTDFYKTYVQLGEALNMRGKIIKRKENMESTYGEYFRIKTEYDKISSEFDKNEKEISKLEPTYKKYKIDVTSHERIERTLNKINEKMRILNDLLKTNQEKIKQISKDFDESIDVLKEINPDDEKWYGGGTTSDIIFNSNNYKLINDNTIQLVVYITKFKFNYSRLIKISVELFNLTKYVIYYLFYVRTVFGLIKGNLFIPKIMLSIDEIKIDNKKIADSSNVYLSIVRNKLRNMTDFILSNFTSGSVRINTGKSKTFIDLILLQHYCKYVN